jgi:hypothetical protein
MPCWPDVWERTKHLLPLLGGLGAVLAYGAVVTLLLWAPTLRKRWLRIASRILGVAAVVPLAIGLPAIVFGLALATGNPPTKTRIVRSQDGQEARLSYDAGFLGRDYTEVALKRTADCRHIAVFWHAGPSSLDDMNIAWLDERHLSLTYHARPSDPQHCEQRVGEVTVVCTSLGWPY